LGRRIAISDIHGCARTFEKLIHEVLALSATDTLYLLGDYINKGPDSRGVLDLIFEYEMSGFPVYCLRGNHEQYLIDALNDPQKETAFLSRGGVETLKSFGVDTIAEIPDSYLNFIKSLPLYFYLNNYLLIHAGLNFELDDPFKDEISMLNIRYMTVLPEKIENRAIIHGHVPTPISEITNSLTFQQNHISIDGGCVYRHIHSLNRLVALDIDSKKLYIQTNID
jgi:serine/threonine protein phosphatase 1